MKKTREIAEYAVLRVFFCFVKRFYTDFTFSFFLILHSDFTMQLWLRDENLEITIT